jgi:hypothetical protein
MYFFLDEKETKKFIRVRRRRPRKFDRPPQGQQLLREFSSSPRRKDFSTRKRRICKNLAIHFNLLLM